MTDRYIEVTVKFPKVSKVERILLVEEDPEYMDFRISSFVEQVENEVGNVANSVSIKRI